LGCEGADGMKQHHQRVLWELYFGCNNSTSGSQKT